MASVSDGDLGSTRRAGRAVIFDAYPHQYGGAQRTDHLLAQGLPALGWEITTVVPRVGTFTDRLDADGLGVEVVPVPRSLDRYGRTTNGLRAARAAASLPLYWARLTRRLRALGPQVVHVVDHRGLLLAGLPVRLARARLVWHVQAMDRTGWLNAAGARAAASVVVPTDAVVHKMPQLRRARDLRAIPNIVPDSVRERPMRGLASEPVVQATGRLHPDKGFDVLLRAMAEVRRAVPGARLRIVGGPQEGFEDHAAGLELLAAELGLADSVELTGFVERPEELLATAACYVQSARERTEILPLAILEAMAVGTPVVATAVGGVADIVRTDETGLLVEPESARALATAITSVLTDRPLAERLRANARALVDEPRFSVDGLVAAFDAAYRGTPPPGTG